MKTCGGNTAVSLLLLLWALKRMSRFTHSYFMPHALAFNFAVLDDLAPPLGSKSSATWTFAHCLVEFLSTLAKIGLVFLRRYTSDDPYIRLGI